MSESPKGEPLGPSPSKMILSSATGKWRLPVSSMRPRCRNARRSVSETREHGSVAAWPASWLNDSSPAITPYTEPAVMVARWWIVVLPGGRV